jgi:hypothetical protein
MHRAIILLTTSAGKSVSLTVMLLWVVDSNSAFVFAFMKKTLARK